jgi:toxin CcdB
MARLDVYPMPGNRPGFVVDVQTQFLDHLATRAVVPLIQRDRVPPPVKDLNPVFDVAGGAYVLVTQAIASVPAKELKTPVASLGNRHDDVTRALDILLIGF